MKRLLIALTAAFTVSMSVSAYDGDWMERLEDDTFVCQLSVPGAHDACASSFNNDILSIVSSLAKTQSVSVSDMLTRGVRLFDLRPCVSGSKLHINHGVASTKSDFDPVMKTLCDFVDSHPSEFCIVVIRHESEGDDNNNKFESLLQESLTKIADHLVDFRPNLTVGEMRGKILFISRDDYDAPIRGGRTVDLADNRSNIDEMLGGHCFGPETHRCSWWLQDHYEISNNDTKKAVIEAMFSKSSALAGKYDYTWVVNQTSGYKGSTSSASAYKDNAKSSNRYMYDLLKSGNYAGPAGLVFMDYACTGDNDGFGLSLVDALIEHNFTYTMSKQGDVMKKGKDEYVLPRGREMMWTAKTYRKEGPQQPDGENSSAASALDGVTPPASNWYAVTYNDDAWQTMRFPTASPGTNAPYYSNWIGTYNTLWIRRTFELSEVQSEDTYTFYTFHDDDYKVYINGSLLDTENGWSNDFNNYHSKTIPTSKLRKGKNVLAIEVQQNWGGAYFDCGVLRKDNPTPSAVEEITTDAIDTDKIYDLMGRKVNGNTKGIVIVNGKKVVK